MAMRLCANRNCNNPLPTGSNLKRAFCCDRCKLVENKMRRAETDRMFNQQVAGFKKNYQLLQLYQKGSILSIDELVNIGFNFDFLLNERTDENGTYYSVGKFELRYLETINEYKLNIIKQIK